MQSLLLLQQSVSYDQPAELLGAGIGVLAVGVLIGAAIAALIVGLILKLVAQGVLGYSVRYGSCFLAVFVAALVSSAVQLALLMSGVITITMADIRSTSGTPLGAIMPYGITVFAITQAVFVLLMTWAIRTFVKSQNNVSPAWGSSFVIAIIMMIINLALSYALIQLGVGAAQS